MRHLLPNYRLTPLKKRLTPQDLNSLKELLSMPVGTKSELIEPTVV
jgi:hypothetical protein